MKHEVEAYEGELKELREKVAKFKTIVTHATAEKTGVYFICGQVGELDTSGLPKQIMVCPSFGLDGFAIYTKSSDYSAPQY